MKINILKDLNLNQATSILHTEGPLRIIAGAGSGKTRVLTRKVAYLIDKMGIHPSRVLAVTFSNQAANEMKDRVGKIIGKEVENAQISTFHSLALKILREDIDKIGVKKSFRVLDVADQKQILKTIYKAMDVNARVFLLSNSLDYISNHKITFMLPKEAKELAKSDGEKVLAEIYGRYEARLKEIVALDFDDLLIYTKRLFDQSRETKIKWSKMYDYVLVDEFQDTSIVQYQIVKNLAKHNNITIVGDPDQTIYTWRGADINIIDKVFIKDFKKTKTITLSKNYRSTQHILDLANKLIKHNKNRSKKTLEATIKGGEEFEFHHGFSPESEARWIVWKIESLRKNKVQLKSIAVFYRNNYLSRSIEQALADKNIDYKIFGSTKFFQRAEVKDAIAYLRVIENSDETSLLRILNVPSRKLGPSFVRKIKKSAAEANQKIFAHIVKNFKNLKITDAQRLELKKLFTLFKKYRDALRVKNTTLVLKGLLKEVGYLKMLKDSNEEKLQNINNLLEDIDRYLNINGRNSESLRKYLEEVSLWSINEATSAVKNFVSLMTLHASKGKEFDYVFIMGMSDSVFPSEHSIKDKSKSKLLLEEERRLAYVGITRAKKKIFFSDSKGYYGDNKAPRVPSRFFKEMSIDVDKLTGGFISSANSDDNYIENREIIVGDKIKHIIFGVGEVVFVHDKTIEVKFKGGYGVKSLMKNHKSIEVFN